MSKSIGRGLPWRCGCRPRPCGHDGRPESTLGGVAGRFDARIEQEQKPFAQVSVQVPCESLVRPVPFRVSGQILQFAHQVQAVAGESLLSDFLTAEQIAHRKRSAEQIQHLPRKPRSGTRGAVNQLAGAAQNVCHALLVCRLLEPVVDRPAIVNQAARVIEADQVFQHSEVCNA